MVVRIFQCRGRQSPPFWNKKKAIGCEIPGSVCIAPGTNISLTFVAGYIFRHFVWICLPVELWRFQVRIRCSWETKMSSHQKERRGCTEGKGHACMHAMASKCAVQPNHGPKSCGYMFPLGCVRTVLDLFTLPVRPPGLPLPGKGILRPPVFSSTGKATNLLFIPASSWCINPDGRPWMHGPSDRAICKRACMQRAVSGAGQMENHRWIMDGCIMIYIDRPQKASPLMKRHSIMQTSGQYYYSKVKKRVDPSIHLSIILHIENVPTYILIGVRR
jgi:hypothetical protein